ncbi:MAG TPA: sporulation protein YqfD [Anaerovoracaceae bacterium]|nr:sporulation protein YqfD [Anaerovoracaceae bacterium]
MRNRGSFLEHSVRVKVEGFEQHKLLTECVKRGIPMRDIHSESDIEMTLTIMEWDFREFVRLAKNRYRITVLKERGYRPAIRNLFSKKSTIAGLIIFALILFYQSTFVSEIRVYGYEKFTEAEVRESLREAGLFEGCSKSVDLEQVKLHIYRDLDNITWIGVKYIGNLAEVTIVEGVVTPKPVDKSKPCDIVADKEGIVEKTIAREGKVAAAPGAYVKPGDVLISGIVPINSTAYGTPAASLTERYVHAAGEVYVKVPYRLVFYQEKYDYGKEPTGRSLFGVHLELGDLKINTAKLLYSYSNSVYTERTLFRFIRPIPVTLGIVRIDEVEVTRREKGLDDVSKEANILVRQAIKEKIPENSQILNKSLKFSSGENIIGVAIMLEALEKIGIEKEIVIGNPTDRGTEDQNRP